MIGGSALPPRVRDTAQAIFARLAEAEARVHGVAVDAVTFHEVGAVDSIVDIVGTAIGLAALDVDARVRLGPAARLGNGVLAARRHSGAGAGDGRAAARLPGARRRRDRRARHADRRGDRRDVGASRRGAAADAHRGGRLRRRHAYAAGSAESVAPPARARRADAAGGDELVEIATNIDDSSPELYEHVMEQLFAAGARDVWLAPAQMKKNRPGVGAARARRAGRARRARRRIVLRETSAIGLRFHAVQRVVSAARADHRRHRVRRRAGEDRARRPTVRVNVAPEYDDCRRIARERGVPLKLVYQAAIAARAARVR